MFSYVFHPRCSGIAGSPLWIAPELQAKGKIDYSNDMWAMGEIFYELIFQDLIPPLRSIRTMNDLTRAIKTMKDQTVAAPKIAAQLGIDAAEAEKVKALLEGMMRADYTKRFTALQALEIATQLVVPLVERFDIEPYSDFSTKINDQIYRARSLL